MAPRTGDIHATSCPPQSQASVLRALSSAKPVQQRSPHPIAVPRACGKAAVSAPQESAGKKYASSNYIPSEVWGVVLGTLSRLAATPDRIADGAPMAGVSARWTSVVNLLLRRGRGSIGRGSKGH
jgi:hypothetical protein